VQLVLHLLQRLRDLLAEGAGQLEDLEFRLADGLLGPRERGEEFAPLALQPGDLALEREDAVAGGVPLVGQLPDAEEFLVDEPDLALAGELLRPQAGDLLLELGDALAQDLGLAVQRRLARGEDLALAADQVADARFLGPRAQHVGKDDRGGAVLLGTQARLERARRVDLALHDGEGGLRADRIEADQHVARGHLVAVADQDLLDDAAVEVLDVPPVGLHDHRAAGDDGAVERRQRRPNAGTAEGDEDGEDAREDGGPGVGGGRRDRGGLVERLGLEVVQPALGGGAGRLGRGRGGGDVRVHLRCPSRQAAPPWAIEGAGAGTAAGAGVVAVATVGRVTRAMTSLRGPNRVTCPSRITMTLSTLVSTLGRWAITITVLPAVFSWRIASIRQPSPSSSRFEFGSSRMKICGSP
jgi:hypothetical protein